MKNKKKSIFDLTPYRLLWEKELLGKITYSLIPFFLIGALGLILYFRETWKMEGYSFLADYTNCFMLCYIFFFMYFVHGLFLPYFHRQVEQLGFKTKPIIYYRYSCYIKIAYRIVSICSVLLSSLAVVFIFVANQNGDNNWYSKLNNIELLYYSFLIVLSWIMSARLFVTILIDCIAIYEYLQRGIDNLDYYNIDKKCGLKGLFYALSASMGFGFYFLIAVIVIICSDFNAHENYGLDFLAYQYWWLIAAVTVILSVIYFSIIIITYISLNKTIRAAIQRQATKVKICNKQSEFLRDISSSFITINDVCIFLLSVLFPGVAAIIQVFVSIV